MDVNGNENGKGSPEKLKRELDGYYSRKIDEINRLVYKLEDNIIKIGSCKTHYKINEFIFN
ncbi:MAG: type II toxin-antitoxin system YoeB family toxin [Mycoplasmataceae bacterium]|nr:type II toxin-antitoxin system YoeB family toxin [Mycoplasmataceae bacterium]